MTEDDSGVWGHPLEVKLFLAVPTGTDLDLRAYVNTNQDASPCGLLPYASSQSTGIGINELATLSWGEGLTANGIVDSRDVIVEVVHKSGACVPWQLDVTGNP